MLLLLITVGMTSAQSPAQLLARLDALAPGFRAATAKVTWVDYHGAPLNLEERQSGTMIAKRYSRSGIHYVVRLTDPDTYGIALRGNTVERFTPVNNLVEQYDIGRYRDVAQKLMALGFGMTGKDLADAFEISDVRSAAVASQRCMYLNLKPKSPDLLKNANRIELWISDELGCAVQQKFFTPGGDYRTVTFSELKLNPKIDDSAMEFPKSAKREKR